MLLLATTGSSWRSTGWNRHCNAALRTMSAMGCPYLAPSSMTAVCTVPSLASTMVPLTTAEDSISLMELAWATIVAMARSAPNITFFMRASLGCVELDQSRAAGGADCSGVRAAFGSHAPLCAALDDAVPDRMARRFFVNPLAWPPRGTMPPMASMRANRGLRHPVRARPDSAGIIASIRFGTRAAAPPWRRSPLESTS